MANIVRFFVGEQKGQVSVVVNTSSRMDTNDQSMECLIYIVGLFSIQKEHKRSRTSLKCINIVAKGLSIGRKLCYGSSVNA